MTTPERLLTDEQVAQARAAHRHDRAYDCTYCRVMDELIASRRLAPLHAAAVALANAVVAYDAYKKNTLASGDDDPFASVHLRRSLIAKFAAARRALEPQPDEPHYSELFGVGFTDDQCIAIRAFVRSALARRPT